MSAQVLVTCPAGCAATGSLARDVVAALDERWVDAQLLPMTKVTGLEAFDAVVLGASPVAPEARLEVEAFVERRAEELLALPAALFGLRTGADPTRADAEKALSELREAVEPLTVGLFESGEEGRLAGRLWAAQLSWTLACACNPEPLEPNFRPAPGRFPPCASPIRGL